MFLFCPSQETNSLGNDSEAALDFNRLFSGMCTKSFEGQKLLVVVVVVERDEK